MPRIKGPRNDALAGGQLRGRKETRAAVAHGQERFTPDGAVELKAEEVRIALAEKARDLDVVAYQLARAWQSPVEGDSRVEQTVNRQPLRDKVDAQIPGEEEVRLTRLDRDR